MSAVVAVADQGYSTLRPGRVLTILADVEAYPRWWPEVRAPRPGRLRVPGIGEVDVRVDGLRPDVGLYLRLSGARLEGHLEWYLEPFEEGTVVNCITNIRASGRWSPRRTLRVRAAVRRAMVALREAS